MRIDDVQHSSTHAQKRIVYTSIYNDTGDYTIHLHNGDDGGQNMCGEGERGEGEAVAAATET